MFESKQQQGYTLSARDDDQQSPNIEPDEQSLDIVNSRKKEHQKMIKKGFGESIQKNV